ncbi:hypothetical protein, partial [Phocaeicola abscessus]|uniref:hypothetical protein n=1 Tax=Phocaeicola abscessus TaxID=555313 RepID=UPI0005632475
RSTTHRGQVTFFGCAARRIAGRAPSSVAQHDASRAGHLLRLRSATHCGQAMFRKRTEGIPPCLRYEFDCGLLTSSDRLNLKYLLHLPYHGMVTV